MRTDTRQEMAMRIKALAAECRAEAIRQGWSGAEDDAYDLTPADCTRICLELGRKPTRGEWRDAGYGHVGSDLCADEADTEEED